MKRAPRAWTRRCAWLLGGAALALAAPAAAEAATTCEYNSGAAILNVSMNASSDSAELSVSGSDIAVRAHGTPLSCTGGTAPLAGTGIDVFENSAEGFTNLSIFEASKFTGDEILLALSEPLTDELTLIGGAGADHWVLGQSGIDTGGSTSLDVAFVSTPRHIFLFGGEGANTISAQGGGKAGAALSGPFVQFAGGSAEDTLEGSDGPDTLEGRGGQDVLRGFGGDDRLISHGGNAPTTFDGGAGTDVLEFPFAPKGATVDLNLTGPQQTGEGEATITGIENLEGGEKDDEFIGDAADNELRGGSGDDFIEGGGGEDVLNGGIGTDTLSYAKAPAAVKADLGAANASGGAGTDTTVGFENLTGTAFADTLIGSEAANTIKGLNGSDAVKALGGPDLVEVRDGFADNASCGAGTDRAISDRRSLDTIQPDCEIVDALPEPGGGGKPGGDTSLDFRLSGARSQRLLHQKAVIVKVRCPDEACTALAGASGKQPKLKLKQLTKHLKAGAATVLKLRLNGKQREKIQARLAAGKHASLKVSVAASDAAGNVVRRSLGVNAKP